MVLLSIRRYGERIYLGPSYVYSLGGETDRTYYVTKMLPSAVADFRNRIDVPSEVVKTDSPATDILLHYSLEFDNSSNIERKVREGNIGMINALKEKFSKEDVRYSGMASREGLFDDVMKELKIK